MLSHGANNVVIAVIYKIAFLLLALCAVAVATGSFRSAGAADHYITIGTGGVAGVYFPAGGAICRLVNLGYKEHGINCSVQSTPGSVYNLNALRSGELQLGVAQSDLQYHAYHGTGRFHDEGADSGLRSLFSMHSEPFTVVVRADSGIKDFHDLTGKRINIGNPESGINATMRVVMQYTGLSRGDFSLVTEMSVAEQGEALCADKVDAAIYTAGHPNAAVREVTEKCAAKIINVNDSDIDRLIAENPFYARVTIPGGMYRGNMEDIVTFGVRTTFVSRDTVSPELIYQVVKALFDNLDNFKSLHPVFVSLNPENMINDGNTAPLHEGAIRYYKERGWIRSKNL